MNIASKGSGYFRVFVNGAEVSRHVQAHKAHQRAYFEKTTNPKNDVRVKADLEYEYTVGVVVPVPVPEPPPPEPPPDPIPTPEPEPARKRGSFIGDPNFRVSSLTGDAAFWYGRFWEALVNPELPKVADYTRSVRYYQAARYMQYRDRQAGAVSKEVGDLRILDVVFVYWQGIRSQLKVQTTSPYFNNKFNGFRMLDAINSDVSKDREMVDIISFGAAAAYMAVWCQSNRHLKSPAGLDYGDMADWLTDWLINHHEGAIRSFYGRPAYLVMPYHSTGFGEVDGAHSSVRNVLYHHYMDRLMKSGNTKARPNYKGEYGAYRDELIRRYTNPQNRFFLPFRASGYDMVTMPRRNTTLKDCTETSRYALPLEYSEYVHADVVDLMLEGVPGFDDLTRRLANTYAKRLIHPDFVDAGTLTARDHNGGVPVEVSGYVVCGQAQTVIPPTGPTSCNQSQPCRGWTAGNFLYCGSNMLIPYEPHIELETLAVKAWEGASSTIRRRIGTPAGVFIKKFRQANGT
jgi:hypothetical protein